MPDPVDKSDDLIAELAKLMAVPASGGQSGVQPVTRPAPLDARPAAPAATPIRIPGLDSAPRPAPVPSSPSTVAPQAEARAPVVGTIRIPGMDQPAPVSTSICWMILSDFSYSPSPN